MDITGIGSIFDFLSKGIDKIFPDQNEANKIKVEMLKLQQEGAFRELELEFKAASEQRAILLKEAEHPSVFVSGGRPAALWVCVGGLFYTFIAQPLLAWAALIAEATPPPNIDTTLLIQLLFGMLGLAGLRSWEKEKGVARK